MVLSTRVSHNGNLTVDNCVFDTRDGVIKTLGGGVTGDFTFTNNTLIALGMMVISAVLVWGFDELAQMLVRALFTLAG